LPAYSSIYPSLNLRRHRLHSRQALQRVTLLYAAHNARRNHAAILRDVLRKP
jgi:uncharacterized protein YeaO (DUF488 family)